MGVDFSKSDLFFATQYMLCGVFLAPPDAVPALPQRRKEKELHMDQTFMKEKKILPLVISMSLPMVISMAVNALYNIVDSFFVAKISENAMTALSLVFPVQNLVASIAVGFGVGMNARIAFCLGAEDQAQTDRAATTGMLLSFVHGLVLTLLCLLVMPWFLSLYTQDVQTLRMGLAYANRVFLFSAVITLGVALEKIFQAVGRMQVSMVSMLAGLVVNIILDPLMIFGLGPFPKMGIEGAAYATGIGQSVTLLVYLLFCVFRPLPLSFRWKNITLNGVLLQKLYAVGIPASLNMALPSVLISSLNGILAGFSEKYVLVLGAYYKLQTFIYLTANGIVQGTRPLISFNYGAGEKDRVEKIFRTALGLTIGVMAMGLLLSLAIPRQLIGLFTGNEETLRIGVKALRIISTGFLASAVSVTCCGALEALEKGIPSLLVSLSRYVLLILPTAFLFSRLLGAEGVFCAFPLTEIGSAVFSFWVYRRIWNSHR